VLLILLNQKNIVPLNLKIEVKIRYRQTITIILCYYFKGKKLALIQLGLYIMHLMLLQALEDLLQSYQWYSMEYRISFHNLYSIKLLLDRSTNILSMTTITNPLNHQDLKPSIIAQQIKNQVSLRLI
jgi:hypothetical protein